MCLQLHRALQLQASEERRGGTAEGRLLHGGREVPGRLVQGHLLAHRPQWRLPGKLRADGATERCHEKQHGERTAGELGGGAFARKRCATLCDWSNAKLSEDVASSQGGCVEQAGALPLAEPGHRQAAVANDHQRHHGAHAHRAVSRRQHGSVRVDYYSRH